MSDLDQLAELARQTAGLLLRDEKRLAGRVRKLHRRAKRGEPIDRSLPKLIADVARAQQQVQARGLVEPTLSYPPELPVSLAREEIVAALKQHQVVIVAGETGSGKTTQLPKMLLEAGFGRKGLIGHTQPRRLAARTVAQRIAAEMQVDMGTAVGYQVRFTDQSSDQTLVKLMTDGILLAEISHDRDLLRYDAIIIDEAHERSLNIDFLLGYLKQLLSRRPELKLVVTSATIDVERFANYFGAAPVISVEGRSYPVAESYLGGDELEDASLGGQVEEAMAYIEQLENRGEGYRLGDVLVFLPGEREIRECHNVLRRQEDGRYEVLPLYARLGSGEQQRIFNPGSGGRRRVILATNVAETSVTVPGIRYVIDSGLARISRYSVRSRVQRLPIEPISQASARQRKGRCGRTAEGLCIRLYSEESFSSRPEYTDPEILRTNLAAVILQMTSMGLGDIEHFPFLEPPDGRQIRNGYRNLEELGALDGRRQITPLGRKLAGLPVDPRIGRILLAAAEQSCLTEMLCIASALAIQDPREWPSDKRQQSQQQHARFRQAGSDVMAWVKLWDYLEQQRQQLSRNKFARLCKREFISFMRFGEWRDLHRQLHLACRQMGLKENQEAADEASVHRALLAGFLSHIGQQDEGKEYQGTRQRRFILFPGSGTYKKPPKWLVAVELVETAKLYARNNAWIEPDWVFEYAGDLLKRRYSEPHWSGPRGQVVARETTSLYGLVIRDGVQVNYSEIDQAVSRQLFIRSGLVESGLRSKAAFWRHNKKLLAELDDMAARSRSPHVGPDDDWLYAFYDQAIPPTIVSQASLERWLKKADKDRASAVFLQREQLLAQTQTVPDAAQFPHELVYGDLKLPLHYRFQPGDVADGVSIDLPVGVLNRVPLKLLEWLVPGLLFDKCCALIKTLPRQLRKHCAPVPDTMGRIFPQLQFDGQGLGDALTDALLADVGIKIPAEAWQPEKLEPFYLLNVRILDTNGKLLEQGRDARGLVDRHRNALQDQLEQREKEAPPEHYSRWEFGELAEMQLLKQGKVVIRAYPALQDQQDGVTLVLQDTPEAAAQLNRIGQARLAMLAQAKQVKWLRKELLKGNRNALHFSLLGERLPFVDQLVQAAFAYTFVDGADLVRDEQAFKRRLASASGKLVTNANELAGWMESVLASHYQLRQLLQKLNPKSWQHAIDDVELQLSGLLYDGFLLRTPWQYLAEYPRYMQAILLRLQRLGGQQQKDQRSTAVLAAAYARLVDLLAEDWVQPTVPEHQNYRWLLEEYRVSLFAQSLGTRVPVSEKRVKSAWQQCLDSLA